MKIFKYLKFWFSFNMKELEKEDGDISILFYPVLFFWLWYTIWYTIIGYNYMEMKKYNIKRKKIKKRFKEEWKLINYFNKEKLE